MIVAQRAFEMTSKAVETSDQMLQNHQRIKTIIFYICAIISERHVIILENIIFIWFDIKEY